MNNNLVPLNLLNIAKRTSGLHNILHTSNSLITTVNNIIPLYSNIKPVINNAKIIHKAFKSINNTNSNENNKEVKSKKINESIQTKKDTNYSDNSISFFI